MADLRIVDAPEIPTEDITGEEKLPTGGNGNYSISLDSLADYTKTKKDLADNTSVDSKVNGVRQELNTHIGDLLNPHQVTKGQIGLGNVDNTADADKPVSNSTQATIISAVAPKADKTYVDNQLTLKANKVDVYTKAETYTKQESSDLVNNSISTALTPVNSSLELAKRGIANRYDSSLAYNSGERVVLTNGDIVKSTIDGNTNNPNSDMAGWLNIGNTGEVESIADLMSLQNPKDGDVVYVKGYYTPTNFALTQPYKGGGTRIYVESRKTENDGFLCINGWVLQIANNTVTPEQAGAKCDGVTDDSAAINKAVNSRYDVALSAGTYATSKPVRKCKRGGKITGTGELTTQIIKTTTDIEGFGSSVVRGNKINFDVDAVMIMMPDLSQGDWYVQNLQVGGFSLRYASGIKGAYGLYIPLVCLSSFNNITTSNSQKGVWSVDSWMVTWNRVQASADEPFTFGASSTAWTPNNTSQTFISCWATNTRGANSYAYNLRSMQYSTFISCGADHNGSDGNPCGGIIKALYSDVTFHNLGVEYAHAYHLLYSEDSVVKFTNPNILGFENRYRKQVIGWNTYNAMFLCVSNSRVSINGGLITPMYLATDPTYGNSVVAFAMAQGISKFSTDADVRLTGGLNLEEYNLVSYGTTLPKFGVYRDAASGINCFIANKQISAGYSSKLDTTAPQIIRDTNPMGAANVHSLFGTFSTYQSDYPNATTANNYPEQGTFTNFISFGNTIIASAMYNNQAGNVYFKNKDINGSATPWARFLHSANTTADANGFIKNASPIIKLFSDCIECNDEAQQQPVTFEKLGVGDYLIKGSSGFAQEGWYVETPKDANGNVLFSVIYTTLENGDISIKTCKKKFDVETASIVADLDKPVDITEGRWIDIRLNE